MRSVNDTELVARTVELKGAGKHVIDVPTREEPAFRLLSFAPNPSPGNARIEFALAREASIRLTIHDLQGRTIRVLADGLYPAGRHECVWHAGDRAGIHAGVYFVRYDWPGGHAVRRIALMP